MRWHLESDSNRIHMAVEGSVGGTTVGLHIAADVIQSGGRVLWVGLSMPNPDRFPQLFAHLSPVSSSKFHAMMIAGALDKAVDSVISAAATLPSVELIVFDDWCDNSGKISKADLSLVKLLGKSISDDIRLLLISKGSIDASGKRQGTIFARAEAYFLDLNYEIWTFSRSHDGNRRTLSMADKPEYVKIVDGGLELVG